MSERGRDRQRRPDIRRLESHATQHIIPFLPTRPDGERAGRKREGGRDSGREGERDKRARSAIPSSAFNSSLTERARRDVCVSSSSSLFEYSAACSDCLMLYACVRSYNARAGLHARVCMCVHTDARTQALCARLRWAMGEPLDLVCETSVMIFACSALIAFILSRMGTMLSLQARICSQTHVRISKPLSFPRNLHPR